MVRLRPDGSGDVSVALKGEQMRASAGSVGVQRANADGTVIFDSRAERLKHERLLADRICAHSGDELLEQLKASFKGGVHDSDNELVHLYEIRDALWKKFGGEKNTRDLLGVSADDWSRLGGLCNDEHLRRGDTGARAERSFGMLRPANWKRLALLHAH
jgi:hypothetical protein